MKNESEKEVYNLIWEKFCHGSNNTEVQDKHNERVGNKYRATRKYLTLLKAVSLRAEK